MESRYFTPSPDTKIHARITREAEDRDSSKPLLVFLHYWGGSSSTWHKITSPDSPSSVSTDYSTIAVDLRGWGQSTGPAQDDGATYSISSMAADLVYVLDQIVTQNKDHLLLRQGIVLVGHSMGAKVALATLGAMAPWMLSKVRGLVLVAPAPPTSLDLPAEMKAQQQVAYESEESVRWTVDNVLANTANLTALDIDMIVRDSLVGNPLAKKAWPLYGMQEDVSESVRKISISMVSIDVRVVVGDQDIVEPMDRVQSKVVSFLQENGCEVSMAVAKNAKHLLPLEAPEIIAQEIRRF